MKRSRQGKLRNVIDFVKPEINIDELDILADDGVEKQQNYNE